MVAGLSTISDTTNIESSGDILDEKDELTFNRNRNESKSYFHNMFLYVEKAMNHALMNDKSLSELQSHENHDFENLFDNSSRDQFEELKTEMIKETLCLIFEEKGYPKLPRCDVHTNLPSQIRNDLVSKLTNNLREISFLKFLENSKYSKDDNGHSTDKPPLDSTIHPRYVCYICSLLQHLYIVISNANVLY